MLKNNTFDQLEPFDLKIIEILDGWEIFQRSLALKVFIGSLPLILKKSFKIYLRLLKSRLEVFGFGFLFFYQETFYL